MTVKSIVDIEVNDAAFLKYKEEFQKYREAAEKLPGAFKATGKETGSIASHFADMTAALQAQAALQTRLDRERREREKQEREAAKARTEEERRLAKQTAERQKTVAKMREDIKAIGRDAAAAFESLGRWAGVGTGVLAGLTVGGFLGLDQLAHGVSASRRSAQGVGVSTGQQQAFRINFGRYIDADSNLETIANTQSDLSQRYRFAAMGVDPRNKDPYQLATEMALRARDIYLRGDRSQQYAEAHGLSQFYSMDDLRRLGATPRSQLEASVRQAGVDARSLALSDETNRKWQNFSIQLGRAGQQIENTLVDKLTPLVPELDKLSAAFAKTVGDLLSNPHIKEWMGDLAQGIKQFADYIVTPKFQSDVKALVDRVADAAQKMGPIVDGLYKLMQTLHLIPSGGGGGPPAPSSGNIIGHVLNPFSSLNPADWSPERLGAHEALNKLAGHYGVDASLLWKIYGAESGYGRNTGMSSKGALGPFQMLAPTAAQYGVKDRTNWQQSAEGAARYLADLMKEFHGDLRKVAAAYNWGQGNVERDVRLHGRDWERFLPNETKGYVNKTNSINVLGLTIQNNTGGSAVVSASQLGAVRY